MINNISNSSKFVVNTYAKAKIENKIDDKKQDEVKNATIELGVSVELSVNETMSNETKGVYRPDTKAIKQLWNETNKIRESLEDMVKKLLKEQGFELEKIGKNKKEISPKDQETDNNKIKEKSEELIAEDGELGVKKVSERIVNFAKALSGGNPNLIDTLRGAIDKGFEVVKNMFEETPDITNRTYDAVMNLMNEWQNSKIDNKDMANFNSIEIETLQLETIEIENIDKDEKNK